MDVTLLWFQCKNPDCGYIPLKTKKDKIKKAWRYGKSITASARQCKFMRYVEGIYHREDYYGNVLTFVCKYGTVYVYDKFDNHKINSYFFPIENQEICGICIKKQKNEKALFQ